MWFFINLSLEYLELRSLRVVHVFEVFILTLKLQHCG